MFHEPGKFDKFTGKQVKTTNGDEPPLYQDVFGETILEFAKKDERIVGITPAMLSGCSLNIMQKQMPERVFDVGIAEQHAVTFAAGLSKEGLIPFCNIYSSFSQRAFDQIIHDVALRKLPVILCLDRGGLVGADGATHHGVYDLAFLSCIPDIIISAPSNEHELRNLMLTALENKSNSFVIRYPRGRGVLKNWRNTAEVLEIGVGRKLKDGTNLAILSIGHPGNFISQAIHNLGDSDQVAHYDMRFLKPIDKDILHEVFSKFESIITVEDGTIKGGLGTAVIEFMNEFNYHSKVTMLGVPDNFVEHGTPAELYAECGFDVKGIENEIKKQLITVC